MKTTYLFIIFLLPLTLLGQNNILIKNVNIFNGTDEELTYGNILIKDNKIAKIQTDSFEPDEAKSVKVIDGQGKYLIPGLIDAHTHLTFEELDLPMNEALNIDWATVNFSATKAAENRLLRGFTTVRNMGGNAIPLAKAIDSGLVKGPRVFPSGAFISQSGGHGDFFAPTDVPRTPQKITQGERNGITAIADGEPEVLKRVREQLRQGATQIKVMAGGGIMSDYDPIDVSQYTIDEFKAAVSAAENFDTYVSTHVYTPKAIKTAIQGGVKSIEHGHLIDEETAKLMAEKDVWLSIQPFLGKSGFPKGSDREKKWNQVTAGTENAYELSKKYNLKMAWGTDVTGPGTAEKEGQRLAVLKKWFSPYEILKIATANNAELLSLSGNRNPYKNGKLGRLEKGAYADMILVDGNPLKNIDLVAKPDKNFVLIIKDGKVYKNELEN